VRSGNAVDQTLSEVSKDNAPGMFPLQVVGFVLLIGASALIGIGAIVTLIISQSACRSKPGNDAETAQVGASAESDSSPIERGEDFAIDGVAKIPTPAGFDWQLKADEVLNGIRASSYLATSSDGDTAIMLAVQRWTARDDAARLHSLNEYFDGLISALEGKGFTNVTSDRPQIDSPVPDRTTSAIRATRPDGVPTEICAAILFGNNTYHFEVYSPTRDRTDRLIELVVEVTEILP